MTNLTIGKVAKRAGVGVETVRFYERKGVIAQPPKPRDRGVRIYPEETVDRIRFIRNGQNLGFSLKEIDELLSLRAEPGTECSDIRNRAQKKLTEVNEKIERLEIMSTALEQLISECPGKGGVNICAIINALEDDECGKKPRKESKYLAILRGDLKGSSYSIICSNFL